MVSTPSASRDAGLRHHRRLFVPFAAAVCLGMLVHAALYANGLVNPDGLWQGEYSIAGSWEASLGRWALFLVDILHAGINAPVLMAFVTILFIAAAGTLAASLFQVRSPAQSIAIAAVLVCSPMVAIFLTYPYCGDAYALSILLGVLAVYAVAMIPGKVVGTLAGTLCVALLMGLYQSSLGVMLAVAFGWIIMRLLRTPGEIKAIGVDCLRLLISVLSGLALYYALTLLSLRLWGVSLAAYKGASGTSVMGILRNIPDGIRSAYMNFKAFFLQDWIAKNAYFTTPVYCLLAGMAMIALVARLAAVGRERPYIPVIVLILLALLPIACNIILLLVPGTLYYLLMTGGMMMTAPLLIAITDLHAGDVPERVMPRLRSAIQKCGAVLAFVLAWVFILSCQTDAQVMQLNKNQTVALANRIWQQVEMQEGYTPDETQVLIVGHPQEGNYPNTSPLVGKANAYANWGSLWTGYNGNIQTWAQACRQYLGVTYESVSAAQLAAITASDAYRLMPLYPQAGSMQWMEGALVVKVSDTAEWGD